MDYKYLKYKKKYLMAQKGGTPPDITPFTILRQLFQEINLSNEKKYINIKFDKPLKSGQEKLFFNEDNGTINIVTGVPDSLMFLNGIDANDSLWTHLNVQTQTLIPFSGENYTSKYIDKDNGITDTILNRMRTTTKDSHAIHGDGDGGYNFNSIQVYKPNDDYYVYPYSIPVFLNIIMKPGYENNMGILYTIYPRGHSSTGYVSKQPELICNTVSEFLKQVAKTTRNNIYLLLMINKGIYSYTYKKKRIDEYSIPNNASGIFKHPDVSNEDVAIAHLIGIFLGEEMFINKHRDIQGDFKTITVRFQAQHNISEFKTGYDNFIKSIDDVDLKEKISSYILETE